MSGYTKSTDFAAKDSLDDDAAGKVIKGTEFDDEFNALQVAVNSKADINSPNLTGTPTAPTATAGTNTTQIATTAFVLTNGVPTGAILMWSGSVASIPSGFVLCDGTNSTPDLRNSFVVGAGDTYAVDATGGSADATLVSHTHTATDSGHVHTGYMGGGSGEARPDYDPFDGNSAGATYTTNPGYANISVSTEGESATNANLPPYYALAYIMKT